MEPKEKIPMYDTCGPQLIKDSETNFDLINVKWEPTLTDVVRPQRSTMGAVGYDVFAPKDFMVQPNQTSMLPLGQKIEIETDWAGILHTRTSYARKGIIVSGGVIDNDFYGELTAIICNTTAKPFLVEKDTACAQLIFHRIAYPNLVECENVGKCHAAPGERNQTPLTDRD